MLLNLKIKNIAVIEEADIEFYSGLGVLTGETGAGKSILIDSISMLTGVRSNKELIRSGEESAAVFGLFVPGEKVWKMLEKNGFSRSEDGLLSVSRQLSITGKSTCRIAGMQCPLSVLKSIGPYLINIHGQQDALELYAPEKHILLLDKWCGDKLQGALKSYRESYKQYIALAKENRAIREMAKERDREIDFLEFEINEIAQAQLRVGEEEELADKQLMFRNGEKLMQALSQARGALFESEGGARERIDVAMRKVEGALKFEGALEGTASQLRELLFALDEVGDKLEGYIEAMDFSEEEMNRVAERLDIIRRMKRKYGGTEQAILDKLEASRQRLETLQNSAELEVKLSVQQESLKKELEEKAEVLHNLRVTYGKKLSREIVCQLEDLNMQGCEFVVDIKKVPYGGMGCDGVEFLISPNKGEEIKPLSKIASGGELSRIMLAIKCIMSGSDEASTYIFDEIDTGVSGRAAEKVAAKLKMVGKSKQTLVITHSSHIAAAGEYHLRIEKSVEAGRTKTHITKLDHEGRVEEIARINSGSNFSTAAVRQAEEMLKNMEN